MDATLRARERSILARQVAHRGRMLDDIAQQLRADPSAWDGLQATIVGLLVAPRADAAAILERLLGPRIERPPMNRAGQESLLGEIVRVAHSGASGGARVESGGAAILAYLALATPAVRLAAGVDCMEALELARGQWRLERADLISLAALLQGGAEFTPEQRATLGSAEIEAEGRPQKLSLVGVLARHGVIGSSALGDLDGGARLLARLRSLGLMLDAPDSESETRDGQRTPLALAACEGHLSAVRCLLTAGADPHTVMKEGTGEITPVGLITATLESQAPYDAMGIPRERLQDIAVAMTAHCARLAARAVLMSAPVAGPNP